MMRYPLNLAVLLAALCVLAWTGPSAAEETIGVVRNGGGAATVTRGEKVLPADPGLKLLVGDALATGADGSLGVILRDDSCLSLGPSSRLVLRSFLFHPKAGNFELLARLSRGTLVYLSGFIGKLAPEKIRFETPTATIGIRGTRFAAKAGEPSVR